MSVATTSPSRRAHPASPGRAARLLLGSESDPRWSRPALWAVLAAASVLYAWGLRGDANEYYAAAVLSGTQSWKAFFFGALDAGSFITVDKPPLALWVMGLSARVFGYGTWSMLLPQTLAGVAAVALVHSAVRGSFADARQGHAAALVAAVAMTLTPITVAINRDNNPDTVLVLLLVLAAWFCLRALRTGRTAPLLVCALLVGLGFNTKMLQAYLVVPAFAAAYLACARVPWPRRVGRLLAAGAVLAVSSAWWMVVVDLWPAGSRPYVGGSTDDSVRDLVIGYNGLGRIFGQSGGGAGRGPGFGGAGFGGEAGAGRLFNDIVGGQISWLLPFCAVALAFAVAARLRRIDAGGASGAAWLLWGGWLAVHYVIFSFAGGTFHPYYTTAMAPAVAALTGMGAVGMWQAYRRSRAWCWVLPLAVAATGGWSFTVLRRTPDWAPWLAWTVLGATAVAVAGLLLARLRPGPARVAGVALAAALAAGLAGPAAYAVTPLQSEVNGTNPTAGPSTGRAGGFGMPGGMPPGGFPSTAGRTPPAGSGGPGQGGRGGFGRGVGAGLTSYLVAHQGNATWLVAVNSAQQASAVILATGRPALAMGGFTGGDPAMTVSRIEELVASGRLRYVLQDGGGAPGRGNSEVAAWVTRDCAAVDGQDGLYDCGS
uniref:glycosyltransferase family 39 protein n=1 Tax=Nonomuraea pusilla TaxID=46177 RepID=UPI0006E3D986|nr:glycosyltransferase family 39 protein [Nonomuraea pusilla]